MKKTQSEQYCQDLLLLDIYRCKATANAVISLASYTEADHFVELSLSPMYHHQYSSLTASVSYLSAKTGITNTAYQARKLIYKYIEQNPKNSPELPQKYKILQTDTTGAKRLYSPKVAGRKIIYNSQNKIASNKPISIGHEISYINMSSEGWSIPLSVVRLQVEESAIDVAVSQLKTLFKEGDFFDNTLTINTLDSKYGIAKYLSQVYSCVDLVSVIRLSSSRKVYLTSQKLPTSKRGAPTIYGEKFYLIPQSDSLTCKKSKSNETYQVNRQSIMEQKADEFVIIESQIGKNNRAVKIEISRFNDLRIRSKKAYDMKDKPFDLIGITVKDAQNGERIYQKDCFLAVSGKRKSEIPTQDTQPIYRQRFGIETFLGFNKKCFNIDNFETPAVEHFDNLLIISQLANGLLWVASNDIENSPRKWEKYQEKEPEENKRLTIHQTFKSCQSFFCSFDKTPFLPKSINNSIGRQKGMVQPKRIDHEIFIKSKKNTNST